MNVNQTWKKKEFSMETATLFTTKDLLKDMSTILTTNTLTLTLMKKKLGDLIAWILMQVYFIKKLKQYETQVTSNSDKKESKNQIKEICD